MAVFRVDKFGMKIHSKYFSHPRDGVHMFRSLHSPPVPGGFLEELPGIFYLPVPTEMVLPSTSQSWRIPPGILPFL
jgi:hypothetical protein